MKLNFETSPAWFWTCNRRFVAPLFQTLDGCCAEEILRFFLFRTFRISLKGVHEKINQRKGPNAELRNLLCMIVTLGTPFKDIWKVLKRKKFLLGSHPVSEKAVQQICGCRVQNHVREVTNVRFMTFSLIFVVVRLGSIPGRTWKQKTHVHSFNGHWKSQKAQTYLK